MNIIVYKVTLWLIDAAEAVGIPYEPAYMTDPRHNWLTGYNYASSGCGILDESGKKTVSKSI